MINTENRNGSSYLFLPFVIAFLILLPVYLIAERNMGFKKATALKLVLSGLCTICSLTGFLITGKYVEISRLLLLVAMVFTFIGDYFLQFIRISEKKFNIGIFSFAMAQISLIVSLVISYGVHLLDFKLTAVICLLVLILMIVQKWKLGKARIPLMIYTLLLAFMVSKAFTVLFLLEKTCFTILLTAGAVLFLASDFLLGIWNYHSGKRIHANLNWITYFSAIMLIALSNWF